jgi:hypothetical protein
LLMILFLSFLVPILWTDRFNLWLCNVSSRRL